MGTTRRVNKKLFLIIVTQYLTKKYTFQQMFTKRVTLKSGRKRKLNQL